MRSPRFAAALLLLGRAAPAAAHRADWLHECGWGVFTHYLPLNRDRPTTDAAAWNAIVDSFNATHLAEQLEEVGACYYFITIGQCGASARPSLLPPCRSPPPAPCPCCPCPCRCCCSVASEWRRRRDSGWYLGPNKAYDDFAGHSPPHTSRRDLISDLHAALAPRNIRLGVYLPYGPPLTPPPRVRQDYMAWL
eukprot:COSAG04_NODE_1742_length_5722_cov_23.916593_2_plen_193_part_00